MKGGANLAFVFKEGASPHAITSDLKFNMASNLSPAVATQMLLRKPTAQKGLSWLSAVVCPKHLVFSGTLPLQLEVPFECSIVAKSELQDRQTLLNPLIY